MEKIGDLLVDGPFAVGLEELVEPQVKMLHGVKEHGAGHQRRNDAPFKTIQGLEADVEDLGHFGFGQVMALAEILDVAAENEQVVVGHGKDSSQMLW